MFFAFTHGETCRTLEPRPTFNPVHSSHGFEGILGNAKFIKWLQKFTLRSVNLKLILSGEGERFLQMYYHGLSVHFPPEKFPCKFAAILGDETSVIDYRDGSERKVAVINPELSVPRDQFIPLDESADPEIVEAFHWGFLKKIQKEIGSSGDAFLCTGSRFCRGLGFHSRSNAVYEINVFKRSHRCLRHEEQLQFMD